MIIKRCGGAVGTYSSVYPPAQNGTYVKATTNVVTNYLPYFTTDPTKSLTGTRQGNQWLAGTGTARLNNRFHIDLGSLVSVSRIYYENSYYSTGPVVNEGIQNFTFWGSNTAAAFAELTYATDTNWTQITTLGPDMAAKTTFDQHETANAPDPKYIYVVDNAAYRYYAFKFPDNYGNASYTGVRRIELQVLT